MSIQSDLERIQGAKANIKAAIEAKGVTVPSNALISTYADYIAQIEGGTGESVPVMPDSLVVSTQKTSAENTPDYVGTYTKQNTPSDWADTYYYKAGGGTVYNPTLAYYICCLAGNSEYTWIITAYNPASQENDPADGIALGSVISDVPVAPQDIRWENDFVNGEQVIVIVEDAEEDVNVILTGAFSVENGLNGTYRYNGTSSNGLPVFYNEDNGMYVFVVEDGVTAGNYAWTIYPSVIQSATNGIAEDCQIHSAIFTDRNSNSRPSMVDWYEEIPNAILTGSVAVSNGLNGTYVATGNTLNDMTVYFNDDNDKYLFVIEDGLDSGHYAWTFGSSTSSTAQNGIASDCPVHSAIFTDKDSNKYPSQVEWYEEE